MDAGRYEDVRATFERRVLSTAISALTQRGSRSHARRSSRTSKPDSRSSWSSRWSVGAIDALEQMNSRVVAGRHFASQQQNKESTRQATEPTARALELLRALLTSRSGAPPGARCAQNQIGRPSRCGWRLDSRELVAAWRLYRLGGPEMISIWNRWRFVLFKLRAGCR